MTTSTRPARDLPEGCFLAYTLSHEAWYAYVFKGKKEVCVAAVHPENGVEWEFFVEEAASAMPRSAHESLVALGWTPPERTQR